VDHGSSPDTYTSDALAFRPWGMLFSSCVRRNSGNPYLRA
jgi:hypothetical protein